MQKSLVLLAILMLLTGCASSEAAESEALPTSTPDATATRTPWPTETPGPTPTPQTRPPDAPPLSEVSENSDGSLSYSRFDYGYQITFPSNWVIYELSESESREFLSMAAEEIPEFEDLFDFSALYSQGVHLIAYDFDPDHYVNEFTTNLNAISIDMGIAPPTLDSVLDLSKQQFLDFFSDMQIYDSYVAQNAVGTDYAFLSYSFSQAYQGSILTVYGNQVMFFVGTDIVTLTISADLSLREIMDNQAALIFDTVSVLP